MCNVSRALMLGTFWLLPWHSHSEAAAIQTSLSGGRGTESSCAQHAGVTLDQVISPFPAAFPPSSCMHRSVHSFPLSTSEPGEHQRLSLAGKRIFLSPWARMGVGVNLPPFQQIKGWVSKLHPGRWDCA